MVVVGAELVGLALVDVAAGLVVTVRVTTGGGANRFSQPANATTTMATVQMCATALPSDILGLLASLAFPDCRSQSRCHHGDCV
jgi:hypothetical protein